MYCKAALSLALVLILLNLFLIGNSLASIPKPNTPKFSMQFIDRSYDVFTTTSIDPYTGQTVTHNGYHVENYTLELVIENQPYTPVLVKEGTSNWTAGFYYNVRFKGHFSNDWIVAYSLDGGYPQQSNAVNTVLTFAKSVSVRTPELRPGSQVDIQVQALIGYAHRENNPNETIQTFMWPWVFTGETSDWSDTQTLTIPNDNSTSSPSSSPCSTAPPSQNLTATPLQPNVGSSVLFGLDWVGVAVIALLVMVVALLLVVGVVFLRRRSVVRF
jgi:hypothetical protein